jgi:hypothetical protein
VLLRLLALSSSYFSPLALASSPLHRGFASRRLVLSSWILSVDSALSRCGITGARGTRHPRSHLQTQECLTPKSLAAASDGTSYCAEIRHRSRPAIKFLWAHKANAPTVELRAPHPHLPDRICNLPPTHSPRSLNSDTFSCLGLVKTAT